MLEGSLEILFPFEKFWIIFNQMISAQRLKCRFLDHVHRAHLRRQESLGVGGGACIFNMPLPHQKTAAEPHQETLV